MKKSLRLTILFLTLSTGLFAQVQLGQKLKVLQQKQAATKRQPHSMSTFNYDTTDKAWLPELNYALTYDQGVLVQETATNNIGVNVSRTTYTYSGKNLTENLVETYDAGNWVNSYRLLLTYNIDGDLIREELQDWYDNKWNTSYGMAREYNQSNTDTVEIIDSMWNGFAYEAVQKTIEIFVPGTKDFSELQLLMPEAGSTSWVNSYRELYTYNLNGKLQSLKKQNWDGANWINFMQLTNYNWDTLSNLVKSYVTQNWNDLTQQWSNYSIDTFEYFNYKGMMNTTYYFVPGGLRPSTRSTYLNDSLMNQKLSKYENWDDQTNTWEAMMHNESVYTYDRDSVILTKVDLALVKNNAIDSMVKTVYFYNVLSGVNNTKTFDYNVYPNPAKNNVNIKLSNVLSSEKVDVLIKNISGQTISKHSFNADNISLDISDLSSGLYLLQINTETGTQTAKLSVK